MTFQFEVVGRDKEELIDKAVAELVKVTGKVESALPVLRISQSITARPFNHRIGDDWGKPIVESPGEFWIGFVDVTI